MRALFLRLGVGATMLQLQAMTVAIGAEPFFDQKQLFISGMTEQLLEIVCFVECIVAIDQRCILQIFVILSSANLVSSIHYGIQCIPSVFIETAWGVIYCMFEIRGRTDRDIGLQTNTS